MSAASRVAVRPLTALPAELERARRGGAFGPAHRVAAERLIAAIRRDGDAAVLRTVRRFDSPAAGRGDLIVDRAALRRIARGCDGEMRRALDAAYRRIRDFHEGERPRAVARHDASATARITPAPLERVGALVPRGAVAYPSTALMTGIPAQIAGVRELIVASPMGMDRAVDPSLAYACMLVEADALYRAGGAAAVAALAYGTKSLARVDKIVGPGNAYAAAAKWLVSADVGIDALQGPSELVIVASRGADAKVLALDLLAQAEHGSGAFAALLASDRRLLDATAAALAPAPASLRRRIFLFRAPSARAAARAANEAAPEHVLVAGRGAKALSNTIARAGAVFAGDRSAVAFGDYVAGTNHCLPTGGTARWSSALRVEDFVRWTSRVDIRAARQLALAGARIARYEQMRYHAESMEARV
jgi:histidinol dehydrogenase